MTVKNFRIALSQLRKSSHILEAEAGRWPRPLWKPTAERLCLLCNALEDKFHFILDCLVYSDLRSQYIKKVVTIGSYYGATIPIKCIYTKR